MYGGENLEWRGDVLRPNNRSKRPTVRLEPDEKYPGMWRVVLPDESRSDMLNRARAKDAAKVILCAILNASLKPVKAR